MRSDADLAESSESEAVQQRVAHAFLPVPAPADAPVTVASLQMVIAELKEAMGEPLQPPNRARTLQCMSVDARRTIVRQGLLTQAEVDEALAAGWWRVLSRPKMRNLGIDTCVTVCMSLLIPDQDQWASQWWKFLVSFLVGMGVALTKAFLLQQ